MNSAIGRIKLGLEQPFDGPWLQLTGAQAPSERNVISPKNGLESCLLRGDYKYSVPTELNSLILTTVAPQNIGR